MEITNHANLPDAIVQAITNDPYPHGKTGDISATTLIGPPQIRMLKRQHWHELKEDAADRIWSLLGQAVHTILERAETVALTEERLFAEVEGWQVSGQFDRMAYFQEGGRRILQDYKVTSVWSVINGPKQEWIDQLNTLRYLATRNGYPVDRLQVVTILRDWSKNRAKQGGDYPAQQVAVIEIPVWSMAETERYVIERVRLHQAAEDGARIDCTPAERWEKPSTWAVRKPNRKTALRVFDDEQQARELAEQTPGGYIEHRPGESTRCMSYCAVRDFCPQWARMNSNQQEAA